MTLGEALDMMNLLTTKEFVMMGNDNIQTIAEWTLRKDRSIYDEFLAVTGSTCFVLSEKAHKPNLEGVIYFYVSLDKFYEAAIVVSDEEAILTSYVRTHRT